MKYNFCFKFVPCLLLGTFFSLDPLFASIPFSGFYGGADLAVSQIQVKKERFAEIFLPGTFDLTLAPDQVKLTDLSILGGLTLGFTKIVKKKYLLGLECRLNFEDLNIKDHHTLQEAFSSQSLIEDYSLKFNQDLALLGRLGIVLDQKYLIFGVLGPDWGKFEISNSLIYTQQNGGALTGELHNKDSAYKAGMLLGLGTEYAVLEKTTIGMEYNYIFHNKLNFSNPLPATLSIDDLIQIGSSISERNGLKSKTNRFIIKLNYYFT